MTVDYPDWTRLIQLIGSNIMLPIDIQASYVMIPVDIQAQYVTLDIDIVAQTVGNIGIDIKAASVGNIGIDIKANTLGNLTIDIEAQSIAVYAGAEWNVKAGDGKTLVVSGTGYTFGSSGYVSYTVPTGKTFYITYMSFNIFAAAAENAELNQMGTCYLYNQTDSADIAFIGGNGGASVSFPAPHLVAADKEVRLNIGCKANHECNMNASCGGYVI